MKSKIKILIIRGTLFTVFTYNEIYNSNKRKNCLSVKGIDNNYLNYFFMQSKMRFYQFIINIKLPPTS